MAPLRISREANCGKQLVQQRDPAVEAPLDLGERQRGAELDVVVADVERRAARAAGRRAMTNGARTPRMLTSTPQSVRAGDQHRVRMLGEQREGLGEVGRPGELAVRPRPGSARRGRRRGRDAAAQASSAGGLPSA